MNDRKEQMARLLDYLGLPEKNRGYTYLLTFADINADGLFPDWESSCLWDLANLYNVTSQQMRKTLTQTQKRLLQTEPGRRLLSEYPGLNLFLRRLYELACRVDEVIEAEQRGPA